MKIEIKTGLIKELVNYAKNTPCAKEGYDDTCREKCLLKFIPYEFEIDITTYKRNLCHVLTHIQNLDLFREKLENAKIKLSIKGGTIK